MTDDPVVKRIREARQQISAECHHEVAEYVAHLRKLDEQTRRSCEKTVLQKRENRLTNEGGGPGH